MAVFNTINTLSNTTNVLSGGDSSQPYSFQNWKLRNNNIPSNDITAQYNAYVTGWYINRGLANAVSVDFVKEYYKTFLKTLGITARTPQEAKFFNEVDTSSDLSLQATIVGYARRLKDIAVYLANKRNHVVYTKLKNNLTGTSISLERMFYNYILNAFTQKLTPDGIIATSFTITSPDILNSLPYLNDISGNFNIEIQELYDTGNYFDRDPSLPINTYTTVVSGTPQALYRAGEYSIPEDYLFASAIEAVAINNSLSMTADLPRYYTFISDGATATYALTNIMSGRASDYQVSVDGVTQTPDTSYTISLQNQTITFCEPLPVNNLILIVKRY